MIFKLIILALSAFGLGYAMGHLHASVRIDQYKKILKNNLYRTITTTPGTKLLEEIDKLLGE